MSSFFPLSPPAHSFFIGPIVINIHTLGKHPWGHTWGSLMTKSLLFLQAHRETTAHFTAIGMPAQQHCDSFRFRRAAFYNGLKSKVGLAAAKTAAMRINLNIDGCGVVAPPVHSSLRAPHLLANLLAHNLPLPRAAH